MTLFTLQQSLPENQTIYSTDLSWIELTNFIISLGKITSTQQVFDAFDEAGYKLEVVDLFGF